jgi:nucleotide-binding universal stress UspA family protein
VIDRERVSAILQKRFPGSHARDLAAAVNAIVGLGAAAAGTPACREDVMIALKNILIATDFGEASMSALVYARELARRFEATLHVLHVVEDVAARLMTASGLPYDVAGVQADLEAAAGTRMSEVVTDADAREIPTRMARVTAASPARAIVEYAELNSVDLIVVGTHGRGPIEHFFVGSVAERVVRTSPCPVLTVHSPEREFVRPDALEVASKT